MLKINGTKAGKFGVKEKYLGFVVLRTFGIWCLNGSIPACRQAGVQEV
jgi:hypothetical protein